MNIAIVGAGITGITLANLLHNKHEVHLMEQSNHIGGACYDEYNEYGVLVQKYGIHIFHTNNKTVWDYLGQFTEWREYIHRVASYVDCQTYVGVPFRARGNDWTKKEYMKYVVEPFNEKRWCCKWDDLPGYVKSRLSFEDNKDFDNYGYFTDKYQGVPIGGYTQMFNRMLDGIEVTLNRKFSANDIKNYDKVIYTGCVDYLLNEITGDVAPLTYIGLDFKYKTVRLESNDDFAQPYPAINYPRMYDYIRVHETKHLTGQKLPYSSLIYESTKLVKDYIKDTSYLCYPYFGMDERAGKYRHDLKTVAPNVIPAGRMGTYHYIDSDDAVEEAIKLAEAF
ncbi:MAG: UDP-galactopyranose mutase [Methanomassiliicoccales archaeon]|jgi:UDP-galactopyranose mutase